MQRLIITGLSSLILIACTTVTSVVRAETTTALNSNSLSSHSTNSSYLKPFNLVHLAYQGELKLQGIPSGNSLILDYQIGRITAADLVKAAVKTNKLPTQVLTDKVYLNAVESQIASLIRNSTY